MGPGGALLITASRVVQAQPPAINVVNTVGCGDALLAGYIDATGRCPDPEDILRLAVAFGSAAALQPVAGIAAAQDIEQIQPSVQVSTIPARRLDQQRTPR
jgi:fructose-1-phosphate kinase PfkB-like protein